MQSQLICEISAVDPVYCEDVIHSLDNIEITFNTFFVALKKNTLEYFSWLSVSKHVNYFQVKLHIEDKKKVNISTLIKIYRNVR